MPICVDHIEFHVLIFSCLACHVTSLGSDIFKRLKYVRKSFKEC